MTNILLTGSSRGIGAAIASACPPPDVTLVGHGTASGIPADFADPAGPQTLWDAALEAARRHRRADQQCRRVRGQPARPAARRLGRRLGAHDADQPDRLAELCRLAIRHWQERGVGGRIVNIASRAAYRGDSPAHWHYAASKAGMVAMTKSIARGYAAGGILAFAVCPGFTMTGMAEDYLASRGGDKLLADIPLGRVAIPEEVARRAPIWRSPRRASMTGGVIDVNGASYVR
jgi:3-oxoacyl-[acyl-carrier protein] reductase